MMLAVMAAVPWLLVVELCLYSACFVCGIVTAAALTISQGHLGGLCMLYGTVDYNVTSGAIGAQTSSSVSVCYFVSAISVSVAIVCFSLSLYWLYTCCIDGEVHREHLWMNLTLGVCGVFLFFLLITGCMLKIGRDSLCESVTHTVPNITRCEEAQNRSWVSPLNGDQFYTSLHKAETAVWVNFFFWLIIGVLVFVQRGQLTMGGGGFKIVGGSWGSWGWGGRGAEDPASSPGESEPFFNRPARPQ